MQVVEVHFLTPHLTTSRGAGAIHNRVLKGETVEVSVSKLLTFVATIVASLTPLAPSLSLRLHLLCAQTADSCGAEVCAQRGSRPRASQTLEPSCISLSHASLIPRILPSLSRQSDAYEFMTGAFTTYEEDISDSRAQ